MAEKEIRRTVMIEQDAHGLRVGIVSAHARAEVVGPLVTGTKNSLIEKGIARHNISYQHVLRPFDLPFAAERLIDSACGRLDGVVCLGLLVRDELKDRFDFQSQAISQGIMKLNVKGKIPVVYGVLTCTSQEQADEFIGKGKGVSADHGWEWAKTLVELIRLNKSLTAETAAP